MHCYIGLGALLHWVRCTVTLGKVHCYIGLGALLHYTHLFLLQDRCTEKGTRLRYERMHSTGGNEKIRERMLVHLLYQRISAPQ